MNPATVFCSSVEKMDIYKRNPTEFDGWFKTGLKDDTNLNLGIGKP